MKPIVPLLCLLLAACSNSKGMGNDMAALNEERGTEPMRPGVRPVRIGEGGPGFNACAYTARVVNTSPTGETYLPLRRAPFAEADETMRLPEGARLFACTRSIDQRWQGVIVPPLDTPGTDCGVTAPVATPRDYAGPCTSGWVASAFVQLAAN